MTNILIYLRLRPDGETSRMPTRLAYKAMAINFSATSYLCKMPIDFNLKQRRLKATTITRLNIYQFAPWLIEVFFFFYFISIGSSTLLILRQIVNPNPLVKIKHILLSLMMNTSGTVVIGTVIYILRRGEVAVCRINWLLRFYEERFPEIGEFINLK